METSENISNTRKPQTSFLSLPFEIRNEIYTHLLTGIDFSHPPDRFTDDYVFKRPEHSRVSIFLVNRQIHDEATRVFYSGNTFPIQISIGGYIHSFLPEFTFKMDYTTPWECFGYEFEIIDYRGLKRKHFKRPFYISCDQGDTKLSTSDLQNLQGPGLIINPSPTYRHLIRNIRLTIRDHRLPPHEDSQVPAEFDAETVAATQTLLLPFLWRLRQILTEKATVEIELDRVEYGHFSKRNRNEQRIRERQLGRKKALELAYFLTLGPWKSNLKLLSNAHRLEMFREEVFGKCEKRPELQEDMLQKMMMNLKIEIDHGLIWGMRDGVLTIFDPSRPPPLPSPPPMSEDEDDDSRPRPRFCCGVGLGGPPSSESDSE
ncbi:hypothetical protein TWF281_004548 [Arthrobotrys megalospora]